MGGRRAWERVSLESQRRLVEGRPGEVASPLRESLALATDLAAEAGLTQAALAKRIGRSPSYVSNMLRLQRLPPTIRELVDSGDLTASHAKSILVLPAQDQLQLARRAVEERWSSHRLHEATIALRGRVRPRRQPRV